MTTPYLYCFHFKSLATKSDFLLRYYISVCVCTNLFLELYGFYRFIDFFDSFDSMLLNITLQVSHSFRIALKICAYYEVRQSEQEAIFVKRTTVPNFV